MSVSRQRSRTLFILAAILLLALALRLIRLDDVSLRGDEAFAIQYWAAPWPGALDLAGREPHPLGTFALFALWKGIFGDGEWIMRLLPALLSLPGVAATYALGVWLFRRQPPALLAALLYAVHPFLIWHAQDVRNYAIWAACSPVAAWAFAVAVEHSRRRDWVRYILAIVLSAYVFFLEPFLIAAQGAYLLLTRWGRRQPWLLAMAGVAILLIPWVAQAFALSRSGYGGTASGFEAGLLLTNFLPALAVGETLPADLMGALWIVLLPAGIGALVLVWQQQRDAAVFLAANIVLPTLLLSLVSTRLDVFRPRYLIAVVPYLILLGVGTIAVMTTRKQRLQWMGAVALLTWGVLSGWALVNHYANPAYRKAPDWRALGAYMTAHTRPGDLVVQQLLEPAFTYYFRGPADETTLPLHPNAPTEETAAFLEEAITTRRAVWLIPGSLPGYDDQHVPLTWLTANAQIMADVQVAGFRVMEFRAWDVYPDEYTPRLTADFGGVATLLDVQIDHPGGGTLRAILYWIPRRQTARPLNGFVHLVGPPRPADGTVVWAQEDHRLPGGPTDSTDWTPGIVRRDVYLLRLPPDLPTAAWTLHLGVYDPANMTRLITAEGDHLEMTPEADLLP